MPHVWPNCPSYISKETPKPRGEVSTSESRAANAFLEQERRRKILIENNKVNSLTELIAKMEGSVPDGVHMVSDLESVSFISLKFDAITKVKYCLRVSNDMSFHITCNECTVSPRVIEEVNGNLLITSCIEVREILTFLESYSKGMHCISDYVKMATEALNCALNVTENEEKLNKIGFLIEQLELLEKDPHGRRYSPELIAMCFMWLKSSTASYKQILNDGVFSLPSIRHLQRLGGALTVDLNFSPGTMAYLKVKYNTLNERESESI